MNWFKVLQGFSLQAVPLENNCLLWKPDQKKPWPFPKSGGGMYLQKSVTVEKNWRDEFSEQSRMGMEPLGEAMIEYQTQTRKQEPTFVPSPSPVSLVKPFQTEWNPPTLGGGGNIGVDTCSGDAKASHTCIMDGF